MNLHRTALFVFLLGTFALALANEPNTEETKQEDPLTLLIAASHHEMTRSDEGYAGPGAALLLGEAERSLFFLIGESHGNVETPAMTAWLLKATRPLGYSTLTVEVGPIVAEQMKTLAGQPDAMAAFQAFHDKWPFTIPFFFWKEEVTMWLEAYAMGYDLWGLDQEFIGSGRFLLHELDGLVEDPELRPKIGMWRKMATEGFQVFATTGESDRGFLSVIDPEELKAFGEKLPAEPQAARRIVDELRRTAIVYQHYQNERYFLNNRDRVRLMKRHLAAYIDEAGGLDAVPRTLFKFGSVHMGRGYSPMYQLDLGNAAAELAAARGSESFHVNVSTLTSVGADGERKDWAEESPELALFGRHMTEGQWGVFDLRGLRPYFTSDRRRQAQPELADLVFRFDVLAVAPEFHAATPMLDMPF